MILLVSLTMPAVALRPKDRAVLDSPTCRIIACYYLEELRASAIHEMFTSKPTVTCPALHAVLALPHVFVCLPEQVPVGSHATFVFFAVQNIKQHHNQLTRKTLPDQ